MQQAVPVRDEVIFLGSEFNQSPGKDAVISGSQEMLAQSKTPSSGESQPAPINSDSGSWDDFNDGSADA